MARKAQGIAMKCLSNEVGEGGGGWAVREEARSRGGGGKQGGQHYAQGRKGAHGMCCKQSAAYGACLGLTYLPPFVSL